MYKFRRKHMTKLVHEIIDLKLQILMWQRIDHLLKEGVELDYLQIFTLTKIEGKGLKKDTSEIIIHINHYQEQPEHEAFSHNHYLILNDNDNKFEDYKIYIIDDGKYATMIFASEY